MAFVETAVGAILSAFLQVMFDRIGSPQFIGFFRERFDNTLLENLKITLLAVNAVLIDAEGKQMTNPYVKKWVDELKDAAYDAEDLLDEIATLASAQSDTTNMSTLDHVCRRLNDELGKSILKLENIAKHKEVLGLKESPEGEPSPTLPTTSLVDEFEVYGRDGDKEHIMRFLLSTSGDGMEVPVVALTGIAGMGKTTLAKLLYNDSRVKTHFRVRAWAYVSEEFDVFKVTKTIYESVTSRHCSITDFDTVQVKLKERLTRKRFLLVLDDVWSENFNNWDALRNILKVGAAGSRIIVTTQSRGVASTMHAILTHSLQQLSDQDCWSLFAKHAFRSHVNSVHPKLTSIGQKIVRKCQGLPLAAKALGSLLHSKVEAREWKKILNSKIWDLPNDKSSILPSLRLSYYYLPSHLKQCFAYCSIFPKGYAFKKQELVLLWMAEGFVPQPRNGETMEEVGDKYFHELLARSFFQQKDSDKFVMHDLINELAQFVSGESCYVFTKSKSHDICDRSRRFSYVMEQFNYSEISVVWQEMKFLRTFLPLKISGGVCAFNIEEVFRKQPHIMQRLRVLSLSKYGNIIEFPDKFLNKSIHLRYLDFSQTAIRALPDSICSLWNLQTLILSDCACLDKLPAKMWKLINLSHLDLKGTKVKEMPPKFGILKNLRTLTFFAVSSSTTAGSSVSELSGLLHLQAKLSIIELQNVEDPADAENAKLKTKKNIKELDYRWSSRSDLDMQRETAVLEKLRPHKKIAKLSIVGYGGMQLPDWLGDSSFSNIVILHLRDCKNCSFLPSLGQLSSLQELYIQRMMVLESINPEFYRSGSSSTIIPFKSLCILNFDYMPNWNEWSHFAATGGEFPSLKELCLSDCPNLTGKLPKHLPSLETLTINGCRKLDLLTDDITTYTKLQTLDLFSSCDSLTKFRLNFLNSLESLKIRDCRSLKFIEVSDDDVHQELKCLKKLRISDCSNLKSFTGGGLPTPNLKSFKVFDCEDLQSMPEQMLTLLTSLQTLHISYCPKLESFPKGGLPPNLQTLFLEHCNSLTPKHEWGLMKMKSLSSLTVTGCGSNLKSFPEDGLLPTSLTSLHINDFPEIEVLNLGELQYLNSLENIKIKNCVRLHSMSEGRLPSSLSYLRISRCSLMTPRCLKDEGEDWCKISHITNIEVNGEKLC